MFIRFNGKRTFRCWEANGEWYGVETMYIRKGELNAPKAAIFHAGSKKDIIDKIEMTCRYDECLENGMDKIKAANEAMFGRVVIK